MSAVFYYGTLGGPVPHITSPLPAGMEVCVLALIDPAAGSAHTRSQLVPVQGYYITGNGALKAAYVTLIMDQLLPIATIAFTDDQLNVDEILVWQALVETSKTMEIAGEQATMSIAEIYKGTTAGGKKQTPEAFLAMALKKGIPAGSRAVHQRVWANWTANDVFKYARAIRG